MEPHKAFPIPDFTNTPPALLEITPPPVTRYPLRFDPSRLPSRAAATCDRNEPLAYIVNFCRSHLPEIQEMIIVRNDDDTIIDPGSVTFAAEVAAEIERLAREAHADDNQ